MALNASFSFLCLRTAVSRSFSAVLALSMHSFAKASASWIAPSRCREKDAPERKAIPVFVDGSTTYVVSENSYTRDEGGIAALTWSTSALRLGSAPIESNAD